MILDNSLGIDQSTVNYMEVGKPLINEADEKVKQLSLQALEGVKIAFYPDYPVRANGRFTSELNPDFYQKMYGIEIAENEPMQQVYIWSKGYGSWQDQKAPVFKEYFPSYLPLRMLVDGQEKQKIIVEIWGQKLPLLCAQKEAKFGEAEGDFQDSLNVGTIKQFSKANILSKEVFFPGEFDQFLAAMKSQKLSTSRKEEIKDLYLKAYASLRHLNDVSLQEYFINKGCLGSGGEGVVYKVYDKAAADFKALKITKTNCDSNRLVMSTLSHVLDVEDSCHLTRIFEIVRIDEANDRRSNVFVPANFKGASSGYLMELLDGDLEELWPSLTDKQKAALTIQQICLDNLLHNRFKLIIGDDKLRNIFYKKIDAQVTFRGQKVQDYDYLRYTIGSQAFYIPVKEVPYLLKRGDYDQWQSELLSSREFKERNVNMLKLAFAELKIPFSEIENIFCQAPKSGSILEMGTDP